MDYIYQFSDQAHFSDPGNRLDPLGTYLREGRDQFKGNQFWVMKWLLCDQMTA